MIFGPLEIFLCLAPFMLLVLTIGVRLAAQNLAIGRKLKNRGLRACPHCRQMLNPEAYICRFCSREVFGESRDVISNL